METARFGWARSKRNLTMLESAVDPKICNAFLDEPYSLNRHLPGDASLVVGKLAFDRGKSGITD